MSLMDDTFTSVHEHFDATDSDITIISADKMAFKLHRKYLEANTGVFPGPEIIDSKDEPIVLSEPAHILGFVFQFIYPRKHPKLNGESFDTVLTISEAVEKYQVFSAMNTCEIAIIKCLEKSPERAAEALGHAIKHYYLEIIDIAVPYLARSPHILVLERLPPHSILPWFRYQEAWRNVFQKAAQRVKNIPLSRILFEPDGAICIHCRYYLLARISELEALETITALKSALQDTEIPYANCQLCSRCKNTCKFMPEIIAICEEGINSIPPFTEFMSKA